MSSFRHVFRESQFFPFWLGQVVSQFGDRINQMALIALVFIRRGPAPIELATVMAFTIVPSFIVGPLAGVLVDRWDRKYTMIIADLVRAALVVSIPLFFMRGSSMVPIYLIVFLVFSASCFFLPSKFSIIPELVAPQFLLIANSLINTTMIIAVVLGVALGGAIIERVGPKIGFYVDAFTYVLSAILLCFIRTRIPSAEDIKPSPVVSWQGLVGQLWRDLMEGVRYMRRHASVQFVFSTVFLLMAAAGTLYITGIVFIQSMFGSVTRDIGFLAVFIGLGFFLGALAHGRFGQRICRWRILYGGVFLSGLGIGCFGLLLPVRPLLSVAALLCVVIGICVGPTFSSASTLIHEVISAHMRGRIFSFLGVIMNMGFLAAMFLASRLAEYYAPQRVIVGCGLCVAVFGFIGLMRRISTSPSVSSGTGSAG